MGKKEIRYAAKIDLSRNPANEPYLHVSSSTWAPE